MLGYRNVSLVGIVYRMTSWHDRDGSLQEVDTVSWERLGSKVKTRIIRNGCLRRIARGNRNESENPKDDQVASSIEQSFQPLENERLSRVGRCNHRLIAGVLWTVLEKTLFKFNFDEKFCLNCCYSSEMSSACSTSYRLIAGIL